MAVRAGVPRATHRGGWLRRNWTVALFSLLMGGALAYVYTSYLRGEDVAPDSGYGYGFAFAGTLLLALVGVGYALRKRLRRNWSGLLHTMLTWHVVGGMFGLALILMHAVGNFHPRTGTYALYSLIALVISGMIGRMLDHFSPRFAARSAFQTLTSDGEERLEALVSGLHVKRGGRGKKPQRAPERRESGVPWDLAYYDLGAQPGEIPTLLKQPGAGGMAQRTGQSASRKGALASESAAIRQAMGSERFYLQLVRVWRYLHAAISIVTLGLILWHLEFAATLLLRAR